MSKDKKQRYLYIDGQTVPVTEQVYQAYWHYERKERYFSCDLKTERFQRDTAAFLPSREDSYERLLEQDRQFACESKPVEEQAVSSLWMEELFSTLSEEERQIIYQLYFLEKSEREVCAAMNLVLSTFQRRKRTLLEKLRKNLEENF